MVAGGGQTIHQQIAARLLKRFGSLKAVVCAPKTQLLQEDGLDPELAERICQIGHLMQTILSNELRERPVIEHLNDLVAYCRWLLADKSVEQFYCLFLDGTHRLIADQCLQIGNTMQVQVMPREIFSRALVLEATSIILVHNHPSKSAKPSDGDLILTRKLVKIAELMDLCILDHVIVSPTEVFSFKQEAFL